MTDSTTEAAATSAPGNGATPPKSAPGRKRLIVGVILALAGLAGGGYYRRFVAPFESTDDAFIEAHVTSVAPQVAGRVTRVLVKDNQSVKQGDLLLEIDPRDYETRREEARAALAAARSQLDQARAQVDADQAQADEAGANVSALEADAQQAAADLKRYQSVESRAVSQSALDLAATQARTTAARVEVARNQARAAGAQVTLAKARIETAGAGVQQAEAAVHQAELNLSYTRLVALEDGRVTRKAVEPGAYVQVGQSLLAIVPHQVWVVANFKETQLDRMRPEQPVSIEVDAYPEHKFKGHVDSIQAGTGARFSLMPPENATGNYVKIVQRVPVKIVFDGDVAAISQTLGPGMSVVPTVEVR